MKKTTISVIAAIGFIGCKPTSTSQNIKATVKEVRIIRGKQNRLEACLLIVQLEVDGGDGRKLQFPATRIDSVKRAALFKEGDRVFVEMVHGGTYTEYYMNDGTVLPWQGSSFLE